MATEQVPRTRCDRPGCNAVVTENGGRFALQANGDNLEVAPPPPADAQAYNTVNAGDAMVHHCSVDLCRACAESLRMWWTAKARAAAKAAP